jgi:hypothetical protein
MPSTTHAVAKSAITMMMRFIFPHPCTWESKHADEQSHLEESEDAVRTSANRRANAVGREGSRPENLYSRQTPWRRGVDVNLCVAKYNSGGSRGLKEVVALWSPAI